MPADDASMKLALDAISGIGRGDITEMKALMNPPQMVKEIMACVMILLRENTDWMNVKKCMANGSQFILRL